MNLNAAQTMTSSVGKKKKKKITFSELLVDGGYKETDSGVLWCLGRWTLEAGLTKVLKN